MAMDDLASRDCEPCRGGVPPLGGPAIRALLAQLRGWACVQEHHLQKRYALADFAAALDLVNRIGRVAEAQDHHPDLGLGWGWVEVRIWTHAIDGLTENDFVLAAKCDAAAREAGVRGTRPS
jgi:4a-hydroxytetrahydrobiopterin dehydratase